MLDMLHLSICGRRVKLGSDKVCGVFGSWNQFGASPIPEFMAGAWAGDGMPKRSMVAQRIQESVTDWWPLMTAGGGS